MEQVCFLGEIDEGSHNEGVVGDEISIEPSEA